MNRINTEVDAIMAFISQGHHSAEAIRNYITDVLKVIAEHEFRKGLKEGTK